MNLTLRQVAELVRNADLLRAARFAGLSSDAPFDAAMVQRLADGIYAARDADEAAAGQPLTYEFEHLIGAAAPSPGARETEALAALDHVARVLGIAPRETLGPRQ